ncbi:NAD(P)/FAD-dependent oxidoreductase [Candidatus Nitrosotenuis cloacae]|uniref:NAD(P)/FAD-dependent oxidoreductase n=1 Tax=Candidatus Nitrosotenuis cloacae TaxID=1603555 RepID=UPI00227D9D77|nr:NAD(P)/FAD-dependent oxidoreductase [Candidatus Nitrosotenuis cloacae]
MTKRILVLGGGFAGVACTRKLESHFKHFSEVEISLVSEDNFLLFTPMLPQVASGTIETRHIVIPIRTICKKATFYEGRVKNIDPYGKRVALYGTNEKRGINLEYDYLVVALGSQTNFFGNQSVESNAYTMKTLNDAVVLRNRIIDMLEQAENERDPILKQSLLTFVVVGAGFAGIETAGEILDFLHDAKKHYPHISENDIKVVVLEALSIVLPGFSERLARFTRDKLIQRGVDIMLNTMVVSFDGSEVLIKDAVDPTRTAVKDPNMRSLQTKTLIWTAGVTPVDTIKNSMFKTDRGRVMVNEYLEVPDFPGVYVIGDCSLTIDPSTGKPYPPTAQNAEAEAKTAAYNLHATISGKTKSKIDHVSKGQMAIIGKRTAIAHIGGMNIHGFVAWCIWRTVYLRKIPKLNKRLRVLLDWTADLLFDRDISRLKIIRKDQPIDYKELDEVDDVW